MVIFWTEAGSITGRVLKLGIKTGSKWQSLVAGLAEAARSPLVVSQGY